MSEKRPEPRATTKRTSREKPARPPSEEAADAGVSDEKVRAATGRGWDDWFRRLDRAGAREMEHSAIARHLSVKERMPDWWCQMVAVGYERARGLRAKHEGPGGFSVGASKTIGVPVERVFAAFAEDERRERLFPGLTTRTTLPHRTARFDRPSDGTRVVVGFEARGPARSRVAVQVERLPDADAAERAKVEWRELLGRLKGALET